MDEDFFISTGGIELLDETEPLWRHLNEHHATLSPHFGEVFRQKTFAARKQAILKHAQGGINVTLILDARGVAVAYCVSTIDHQGVGEVDSLYVSAEQRQGGFGHTLMKQALTWFKERGVKRVHLAVASGNEGVYSFYAKYGFFPAKTILEQMPELTPAEKTSGI